MPETGGRELARLRVRPPLLDCLRIPRMWVQFGLLHAWVRRSRARESLRGETAQLLPAAPRTEGMEGCARQAPGCWSAHRWTRREVAIMLVGGEYRSRAEALPVRLVELPTPFLCRGGAGAGKAETAELVRAAARRPCWLHATGAESSQTPVRS
mmetsp:Transcript_18058/g.54436  ORF Transcript_18058/g.54436 Transcript_18058/m.54436 type:complete len:154 (-) Transcript_18058:311-772(-)